MVNVIEIDNIRYYKIDDLVRLGHRGLEAFDDPKDFLKDIDCKKGSDYLWARFSQGEWLESENKSDTLLVCEMKINWIETCYRPSLPKEIDVGYFKNQSGDKWGLDVVGKRRIDECYFECGSVGYCLKMPLLKRIIKSDVGEYIHDVHYKYFVNADPDEEKKSLYLTYQGLIKVFENYRPKDVEAINGWINKMLDGESVSDSDEDESVSDSESSEEDVKPVRKTAWVSEMSKKLEEPHEEIIETVTTTTTETKEVTKGQDVSFEFKINGMEISIKITNAK